MVTFINCQSKEPDPDTGERKLIRRPWTTTVFHISQTELLDSTGRIDGCVFVFTCNGTERLEARFLSRCLVIEFSSYGMAGDIAAYLERVWHAEGGNGNGPDFARLAKDCRNNVRDCLGRLEVELMAL